MHKKPKRERTRKSLIKLGQPPGTLVEHAETGQLAETSITVFRYTGESFSEQRVDPSTQAELLVPGADEILWVDMIGLADTKALTAIGKSFGIHSLVLEDIQNTEQRPKFEDYGDYYFTVIKMLSWDEKTNRALTEQVSLLLGRGWVLSFQEHTGDTFDFIRNRLRDHKGRIRSGGADYLQYALIDSIVDYYFNILEEVEILFDAAEAEILSGDSGYTAQDLHGINKQITELRKAILPCREVVYSLQKTDLILIAETTRVYYRDIYDHVFRILDTQEIIREKLSSLFSVYTAEVSNKMNSIMKVLTIISTIFIPVTFIAGVYGMNFAFMPGITHPLGFPLAIGAMGAVALGMILFFLRKGWFTS